jgi:Trypsin
LSHWVSVTSGRFIPLVFALVLSACSESESFSVASQAIVDGTVSGIKDDATVVLKTPGGLCSAVLVAPNLVMTARHCIAVVNRTDTLDCKIDGTSASNTPLISGDYKPSEIWIYLGPGSTWGATPKVKRVVSTESTTVCRNDLALVELEEPISDYPILPIRLLKNTYTKEKMTVIGFGHTGAASAIRLRYRREGVEVLRVGPNRFNAQGGQAVRGTFVVSQGPCQGDSGGPAIAESTGAIAGIYSIMASDDCSSPSAIGVYVQVAEYYELVLQTFDEIGVEPWLEGDPPPAYLEQNSNTSNEGCALRSPSSHKTMRFLPLGIVGFIYGLKRFRRRGSRRNTRKTPP